MNLDKDLRYMFAYVPKCLWILGIWPDPRISVSGFRLPSIRFIIVMYIVTFYMAMPHMVHMFRVWGNIGDVVKTVTITNISLMALGNLTATWYYNETLRTLIASFMADWINSHNQERNTMLRLARRGRYMSFRHVTIVTVLMSLYMCFNIQKFYRNINQSPRSLIYYFLNFYNDQKSPNYEITFVIQICGGLYAAFTICTIDCFITMMLMHVCGQLINLRIALNKLVDELANNSISSVKFKKGLAVVAVRHGYLIRNAKMIDNCYSTVLLLHFVFATYQVCFQFFNFYRIITDELDVSAFEMAYCLIYILKLMSGLYNYCYSAERLSAESSNMAYGVYECKWYNIPVKDAKDLILIAHGSSIPLRLTAGKFAIFSMELLGASVKTAMGFISMLVTIKG